MGLDQRRKQVAAAVREWVTGITILQPLHVTSKTGMPNRAIGWSPPNPALTRKMRGRRVAGE